MRKLLIAAMLLLPCAANAGTCDSGSAFDAGIIFNNANASSPTILTAFTAGPSGAKITAVWSLAEGVTDGSLASYIVGTKTGANVYPLYQGYINVLIPLNFLVAQSGVGNGQLTNIPVDGNGNPSIFLGPGDSLTIQNANSIPPSGGQAGNYIFHVMGQQC